MNDDNNMYIWNHARAIPKEYAKPFKIGSRDLTAITPLFLFQRATELWGAIGQGWGFSIEKDEMVRGGAFEDALHVMTVKLWYTSVPSLPGIEGSVSIRHETYGVGCTRLMLGKRVDDEFNKKTLTDALTNALSRLGFGANIRMDLHEGSKYADAMNGDEVATAWGEYIAWRRRRSDTFMSDKLMDLPDDQIKIEGEKLLSDNSRSITPEHIRELITS